MSDKQAWPADAVERRPVSSLVAYANAGWDSELLKIELADLKTLDFDLALTGFSLDELGGILADKTAWLTDPDET